MTFLTKNTITLTFPQWIKHLQDSKVISQPLTEQIGDGNEDVWTSDYSLDWDCKIRGMDTLRKTSMWTDRVWYNSNSNNNNNNNMFSIWKA